MTGIDQLLSLVRRYSEAQNLSESTVSAKFLGGGRVIRDLRDGRDMGVRRIERAVESFAREWPADAEWPADVPRPAPTPAAAE